MTRADIKYIGKSKKHKKDRYILIDKETGEIIRDEKGKGFPKNVAERMCNEYNQKQIASAKRSVKKTEAKRREDYDINAWVYTHKDFMRQLDGFYFEMEIKGSWGPDDKVDADFIRQQLVYQNIQTTHSAEEIYKAWKKNQIN